MMWRWTLSSPILPSRPRSQPQGTLGRWQPLTGGALLLGQPLSDKNQEPTREMVNGFLPTLPMTLTGMRAAASLWNYSLARLNWVNAPWGINNWRNTTLRDKSCLWWIQAKPKLESSLWPPLLSKKLSKLTNLCPRRNFPSLQLLMVSISTLHMVVTLPMFTTNQALSR